MHKFASGFTNIAKRSDKEASSTTNALMLDGGEMLECHDIVEFGARYGLALNKHIFGGY